MALIEHLEEALETKLSCKLIKSSLIATEANYKSQLLLFIRQVRRCKVKVSEEHPKAINSNAVEMIQRAINIAYRNAFLALLFRE